MSTVFTPSACRAVLESDLGDDLLANEKTQALIRVIDDDRAVRDALTTMLEIEGYAVAPYACAEDYLRDLQPERIGCLILDVRMPGMSGLELQTQRLEARDGMPIIFLTGYADVEVAVSSLQAGAVDFLMKPVDEERLFAAINKAVHRDVLRRLGVTRPERIAEGAAQLSERELHTLSMICRRLTDAQMAERFGVSIRTVEGHRAKLYTKFAVHSGEALTVLMPDIRAAIAKLVEENRGRDD